jgi:hypothetical protein
MRVAGECHRERSNIAGISIDMDRDPGIRRLLLLQPQRDACDELPSEQVIPHHGVAAEQPDP